MNLLITGAPGSGKGTISSLLIKDANIEHISTGDMLRNAVANKTPTGLKAKAAMDEGNLVSDDIVNEMVAEYLQAMDKNKGFLLDGYPRTYAQALTFEETLKKLGLKIDGVINLVLDDEIVTKRALGRRICPKCNEVYNIYFMPPKAEGKCDVCGSDLIVRKDDNEESIKIRLSEFHKNSKPIIDYYNKANLLINIDSSKELDEQYADLKKALEGVQ